MTKEEAVSYIDDARNLLDKVYYFAEKYNIKHRTNASTHMLELERLLSWCDSCAMDAQSEIKKHFEE